MFIVREAEEVTTWMLAFYPDGRHWWTRIIPGRFKHVAAFAWAPLARTWVFFDASAYGTKIILLPGSEHAPAVLTRWADGASILRMSAAVQLGMHFRIGCWCVPSVKHLLGLRSGAVLPDGLWRDCLRAGASVVTDDTESNHTAA